MLLFRHCSASRAAALYSRICLWLPARPWAAHPPSLCFSSRIATWKSFSSCSATRLAGFREAEFSGGRRGEEEDAFPLEK